MKHRFLSCFLLGVILALPAISGAEGVEALSEGAKKNYDMVMRMPKYPFTVHGFTKDGAYFKYGFDSLDHYTKTRGEEKGLETIAKAFLDVEKVATKWCEAKDHKTDWGKPGTAWFVFDLRSLGNTKMTLTEFSQVTADKSQLEAYQKPENEGQKPAVEVREATGEAVQTPSKKVAVAGETDEKTPAEAPVN